MAAARRAARALREDRSVIPAPAAPEVPGVSEVRLPARQHAPPRSLSATSLAVPLGVWLGWGWAARSVRALPVAHRRVRGDAGQDDRPTGRDACGGRRRGIEQVVALAGWDAASPERAAVRSACASRADRACRPRCPEPRASVRGRARSECFSKSALCTLSDRTSASQATVVARVIASAAVRPRTL